MNDSDVKRKAAVLGMLQDDQDAHYSVTSWWIPGGRAGESKVGYG